MNALEFAKHLSQSSKRLKDSVSNVFYEETITLKEDLQSFSPVDKGDFKQDWRVRKISSNSNVIFHMRVENKSPYGIHLDQGVDKGAAPWYFPRPDKPPSGKLILRNGRVWAGGLSPSGFVVGGIIDKIIFYNKIRINKIARRIAEAVVGAI